MKKIISMLLVLVMATVVFAGCAKEEPTAVPVKETETEAKVEEVEAEETVADETVTIGVTLQALTHVFYQDMEAAMLLEAATLGIDMQLLSAEWDANTASNQIRDFVQKKVDAIIVCPPDSKAVAPAIQEAVEAGIPVFTVDVAAEGADVISHIASDNLLGGYIAGQMMAEALADKEGTVVIVDQAGVTSVQDRVSGFEAAMTELAPHITVAKVLGEGKRDVAMSATEDTLQKYGDNLVGLFGINDDSALGALAAVEAADKVGIIAVVGYDATPQAREAILAGKMIGDTIQFPGDIGVIGLRMAYDYVTGVETSPVALVPVAVGSFRGDGIYDKDGNKID